MKKLRRGKKQIKMRRKTLRKLQAERAAAAAKK